MRRFRFRLAPLLRLRSQLERAARRELARATAAVGEIDRELEAVAAGRREFAETAEQGGMTGRLAQALAAGLGRREMTLLRGQREAESAMEAARQDYLRKAKELGALEKLESRGREAWLEDVQRAEQEELDEVAQLGRQCRRIAESTRGEAG